MIGTTVARYRILAPLGGGGMGVVWEAEDLELGRRVALKLLPEETLRTGDALERFKREARAASALNHPHICTVYDVGLHAGQPFLVMERLVGHTLRHAIAEGPLAAERIIALGEEIADALDAAHRAGIVHRDLKPANLFVTQRGEAKVLDFGVAKMATQDVTAVADSELPTLVDTPLTQAGTVVGTLAYMSPEQASGRQVDARSDLFSLGVVLYEMATGRLPFEGSGMAVVAAILQQEPRRPSDLVPDLPARLEEIVLRALAKDPSQRYQSAADLGGDLRQLRRDSTAATAATPRRAGGRWPLAAGVAVGAVAAAATMLGLASLGSREHGQASAPQLAAGSGGPTAPTAVAARSIAVLPFADLSPGQDQEYFSDGISEELSSLLARIPELRVSSRTSASYYKGKDVRLSEIARELKVAHLLEGSVRKAGQQVRISVQLIDAATDTLLWSEQYDRTLGDIFALQDEIAADVVARLQVSLLGAVPRMAPTDPEAFARYLQARHLARERTAESLRRSNALYEQALAIDERYGAAWDGLAWNLINQAGIGERSVAEGYLLAREAAAKAQSIDPNDGQARACLGWIAMRYDRDLAAAAQHFERALALAPDDLDILGKAALLLVTLGRLDEAIQVERSVVARDPLDPSAQTYLATFYRSAGRFDLALDAYRTALRLSPDAAGAYAGIAVVELLRGHPEAALAAADAEPLAVARLSALAMIEHARGHAAASDAALGELIGRYEQEWAYPIAFALAYRDDHDRAFEWLAKAGQQRGTGLTWVLVDNLLTNLHADPRWPAFLVSIGRSPAQLASIRLSVPLPK